MSAGGAAEGDLDLNIAPIIDCFTVLIAYLLVSMSFISLSILEASVSASGPAPETPQAEQNPPVPPLSLSVELAPANGLVVKLTGGAANLDKSLTLEGKAGGVDVDGLKARIGEFKQTYPDLKEVNVSADPVIRYKAIVKVIEAIKPIIPKVFLASS